MIRITKNIISAYLQELFMAKAVGILPLLDDESRLPKVNNDEQFLRSPLLFPRQLTKPLSKNSIIISVRINTNVIPSIETANRPLSFITMPAKSRTVHWDFSRKIEIHSRIVSSICSNIVKMISFDYSSMVIHLMEQIVYIKE